jgi:prepilin-type N-terminal cleavage/methylation domain-containing protein
LIAIAQEKAGFFLGSRALARPARHPGAHPKSRSKNATWDDSGFSLLEVMVALAVLALGLTAAFKLQVLDLNLVRAGGQTTRTCLAAESLLWRATALTPPVPGQEETGQAGPLTYTVQAAPDPAHAGLLLVRTTLADPASGRPGWVFERRLLPPGEPLDKTPPGQAKPQAGAKP